MPVDRARDRSNDPNDPPGGHDYHGSRSRSGSGGGADVSGSYSWSEFRYGLRRDAVNADPPRHLP